MNKNNNIEDDMENIPNLNRSGNKNPFTPNGDYFDEFANRLHNRIDDLEEIKEDAPVLISIPKYNPFEVPVDYFDELPTLIQKRCISQKPETSFREWFNLLIRPRFIFPVLATLLIAFAGIKYINDHPGQTVNPVAEEINVDDLLQTIDETTIVDELTAESEAIVSDSENDRIVNYLIENNIDLANLNNEL